MAGQHTPGPWETNHMDGVRTAPRSYGSQGGVAGIAIAEVHPAMTDEERKANARLIAAAPDLLAVAEMVEILWRGIPEIYRPGREHGLRAVRAAIKLATEGRPLTDEDRAAIARAKGESK